MLTLGIMLILAAAVGKLVNISPRWRVCPACKARSVQKQVGGAKVTRYSQLVERNDLVDGTWWESEWRTHHRMPLQCPRCGHSYVREWVTRP